MIKSGSALLIRDIQGVFLQVGLVVSPADIERLPTDLEVACGPWDRFAEDIHLINCAAHEYGQRSRPWLRQKKGRGSK